MRETLKEFMESYEGFDFDNGTIVLIQLESGISHIIEKNTCWGFLLEKYADTSVWHWNNTEKVMVITLFCK